MYIMTYRVFQKEGGFEFAWNRNKLANTIMPCLKLSKYQNHIL